MRLVYRLYLALLQYITTPINRWAIKLSGGSYGNSFQTRSLLLIRNYTGANGIIIGNSVNINSNMAANPVGGSKTVLYVNDGAKIKIGSNIGISNATICAKSGITIEDNVTIGAGVSILDSDFHPLDSMARQMGNKGTISLPIRICKNAFIGANATILKGVTIGEESIIGACSVVTKSIPPREIWAGNPAKFIRTL